MNAVAILLSKENGEKKAKAEREIEELKERQKRVERRVGALERQISVIRRKQ